ncbi:MAG: ABC transporter ATP-binding protein [Ilumatobacteraceae bacterium]
MAGDRRLARARESLAMLSAQLRLHPRPFVVAVLGASIFALGTIGSSIAVEWVSDNVILPRFEQGAVATGTLLTGVAFVVGIGLVRASGVVLRRTFAGMTQWRIAGSLSRGVVDRLVRQPLSWHQRRPDGDLVARAGVDTDAAVSVLAPIPFACGTVLLIVVSAIWLLINDLVLGGVAVVVFPLLIGMNIHYQHRVEQYYDAAQNHLGDLSAGVHESFDGVQLIKAYGAEQRETERLATLAGYLRAARVKAVRLRGTFDALLDAVPSLSNVGLIVIGAMRVEAGAVTIGQLASFIYLFTLLVFPLRLIGYALSELPHSLAGWRRVRAVLDEPIEADPRATIGRAPDGVAVRLDHVRFVFPGERLPAIDDVSLSIAAGRIVAVVGPTGAGKSTLVELVAGLVAPTAGVVELVAGRPAIVFQEAFLFSGTIRHNLELGSPVADAELWDALRLARADRFVAETADGLGTVVGERGVTLSGGQRQRVALARALLRRPSLLLLDDTTSALDPATEAAVLINLREGLARSTTVVMVASRPSTIRLADEVVYLAGGRVVDHGPHDELMARRTGYRALVEAFETDRAEHPTMVAGGGAGGAM